LGGTSDVPWGTAAPTGGSRGGGAGIRSCFDHTHRTRNASSASGAAVVAMDDGECTPAKVKSYVKLFLAQLFSHVGLCALVIAYSILGAFIFSALEQGKESTTRSAMEKITDNTLGDLYNITGKYSSLMSCHYQKLLNYFLQFKEPGNE